MLVIKKNNVNLNLSSNKSSIILCFVISLITGKSEKVSFEILKREKNKDEHIKELKNFIKNKIQ